MLKNKSIPSTVKSYYEFYSFYNWHQLIKVSTRMTCNTTTIIFGQEKFLVLKEAHIDILSSARSSITRLIFFEETLTYINFHKFSIKILMALLRPMITSFRNLWLRLIR